MIWSCVSHDGAGRIFISVKVPGSTLHCIFSFCTPKLFHEIATHVFTFSEYLRFRKETRYRLECEGNSTGGFDPNHENFNVNINNNVTCHVSVSVISDIPLDVRQTVCHCLDGEYRALTNGRVTFAIEMNISEVEARAAKDADTIILKLLTHRVPVYKILKALDKIERDDAVHVIARWLQHIEHS